MTVFLITTEEMCDSAFYGHDTLVYSSIEKAKRGFRDLVDSYRTSDKYKEWMSRESIGLFETWSKNCPDSNYLSVYLTENDVI